MKIEKILFYLGCLVIAVGLIGGIYQWVKANETEDDFKTAYDDFYEAYNGYYGIEDETEVMLDSVSAYQKSSAYMTILGSIIGGLLIIGFSTLISLVRELVEVNRKTNSYLDYFKVKPLK